MDVGALLVTDPKAPHLAQPCQRPLNHPTVLSELLARIDATSGDACFHAPLPKCLTVPTTVVSFVGVELLRAAAWSAARPADRFNGVEERFEHGRLVAVGGGQEHGQRHALAIYHKMALRARFRAIRRIRPGLFAPFFTPTAGIDWASIEARLQSMRSASPSRSRRTRCSLRHTPASFQSRRRRQQVMPLPQPISCGSISQGMPVIRTKRMPVSAARSGTRGRPPFGLGGSAGRRGSTTSQSSSGTSGFAMRVCRFEIGEPL